MIEMLKLPGDIESNLPKIKKLLAKQVINDYKEPKKLYFIRKVALSIVSPCKRKDYLCECNKITNWVYSYFRYVKDPNGVELFISPYKLLVRGLKDRKLAQADCETLSQLVALLCMSLGHSAKLLLVDTNGDGKINHCIALIKPVRHGWYFADVTVLPNLTKKLPYSIYRKEIIDLKVR